MATTLSTSAILQGMADALPTHAKDDDSSDLASSYEVVALLVHSYLAALNFSLLGFDEDKPLPECSSLAPRLPPQWNNGFGSLSFFYKHKQSSMRFVFRIDRMGAKVEVRGLAVGDDNIRRFERSTRDLVKNAGLPLRITMTEAGEEDRTDLANKIEGLFVSEEAIADFLQDLKVSLVQKLIPKLQREGYVETAGDQQANAERRAQEARDPSRPFAGPSQPNHPYPQPGPLPEAARPQPFPAGDFPPPGFEDEHEINRPPRGLVMPGGQSPFSIGHSDLHPPGLGPHDPLRGSFHPGGLPRPGAGGGMHPTFDDPLFQGQGGGSGYGGFAPQAPPGARWDPVGPGSGPQFPGQFPRPGNGQNNPFGGGGYGGNGFGGGSYGGGGGFGGGGII